MFVAVSVVVPAPDKLPVMFIVFAASLTLNTFAFDTDELPRDTVAAVSMRETSNVEFDETEGAVVFTVPAIPTLPVAPAPIDKEVDAFRLVVPLEEISPVVTAIFAAVIVAVPVPAKLPVILTVLPAAESVSVPLPTFELARATVALVSVMAVVPEDAVILRVPASVFMIVAPPEPVFSVRAPVLRLVAAT
jgi:hypothetical protein